MSYYLLGGGCLRAIVVHRWRRVESQADVLAGCEGVRGEGLLVLIANGFYRASALRCEGQRAIERGRADEEERTCMGSCGCGGTVILVRSGGMSRAPESRLSHHSL